jgi:hypothetical protein
MSVRRLAEMIMVYIDESEGGLQPRDRATIREI